MAAPSVVQALQSPGVLVADPTDVTDPKGTGTQLGFVRDVVARRVKVGNPLEVVGYEFGAEIVEELYRGTRWFISFALRGFDSDAISTIFPGTFTGSSSKKIGIREPVSARAPGETKSQDSVVLMHAPDDATHNYGVIFYRALPSISDVIEINLGHGQEMLVEAGFKAIRDTSGRLVEVALIEDMTAL